MKKTILSFAFVLALATVASAAPKFGIMGSHIDGIGLGVVDTLFDARVLVNTESNDQTSKTEYTHIVAELTYKIPLSDKTGFGIGVRYKTTSGKNNGTEIDKLNDIGLALGVHHFLEPNLILSVAIDVYQQQVTDWTKAAAEMKTTYIGARDGRVGIGVLF